MVPVLMTVANGANAARRGDSSANGSQTNIVAEWQTTGCLKKRIRPNRNPRQHSRKSLLGLKDSNYILF